MSLRRLDRVESRLALRQPDLTVLLDGVHKPHNVAAIVRSCDAVGVLEAHAVPPRGGLRVAKTPARGSRKWLPLVRHRGLGEAVGRLKGDGFQLVAAHPVPEAVDYRELDYVRPTAFVLGTEREGVSAAAVDACDALAVIPMQGMVASLNVSVAAALLLFEAQRQRVRAGLYERRRIDDETFARLRFEWLHPRYARYFQARGEPYPEIDAEGDMVNPLS